MLNYSYMFLTFLWFKMTAKLLIKTQGMDIPALYLHQK